MFVLVEKNWYSLGGIATVQYNKKGGTVVKKQTKCRPPIVAREVHKYIADNDISFVTVSVYFIGMPTGFDKVPRGLPDNQHESTASRRSSGLIDPNILPCRVL